MGALEHTIIVSLLKVKQLPPKFIWGYLSTLSGVMQVNFMTQLYQLWFIPNKVEEEQPKEVKHQIHLFRKAIQSALDYGADKALIEEWLTIYLRYQTGDFITKKQRIQFIDSTKESLDDTFLQQQAAAILAKITTKKTYKYTNKDVEHLLLAAGAGKLSLILINDKKSKEFWAVNSREEVWYFDGQQFAPDPFGLKVDMDIPTQQQQLAATGMPCSNRLFFWSGKKTINLLKRYGNTIVLYFSQYYSDRGEALFVEMAYCHLETEEQIALLLEKVKNSGAHSNQYFDKRVGFFLPVYRNNYFTGFSIYKNHYVTISQEKTIHILKSFASNEAALAALEKEEMKMLQENSYLYKINTFNNIEAIGQFESEIQR